MQSAPVNNLRSCMGILLMSQFAPDPHFYMFVLVSLYLFPPTFPMTYLIVVLLVGSILLPFCLLSSITELHNSHVSADTRKATGILGVCQQLVPFGEW